MNLYDDNKTVRELYAAYHTILKQDVKSAIVDAVEAFRKHCDEGQENDVESAIESERDSIEERLNEEADSFVTYTRDAQTILFVSENEDAAEEELGDEEAAKMTTEQRAYYAYMADARRWLDNSYFIADIVEELSTAKASA
jgi:hypothetical protein